MTDQIVITEKSNQAKDARAAVGSRFGDILPAEGHLIDLLEPEDVVPQTEAFSAYPAGERTHRTAKFPASREFVVENGSCWTGSTANLRRSPARAAMARAPLIRVESIAG